jgi:hypothetical protein
MKKVKNQEEEELYFNLN